MLKVLLESSARHAHVTKEHLAVLFGEGHKLHNIRELSQPGQYLTEEKIRIEGPRGAIDKVSILGPERPATQVEVSFTDARTLGISPPIRESGDVAGSAALKLIGPVGSVEITEGAIAAKRHIHLTPDVAEQHGLKDKQIVSVKVGGDRGLIFGEVVCRVHANFSPAMHIDYDESNAAGLSGEVYGEVLS
jgi:putative phosphotransacetylase